MEKQRDKTAKRLQRKLTRGSTPEDAEIELDPETGEPILPAEEDTGVAE